MSAAPDSPEAGASLQKERLVQLGLRHPAMPCRRCGARVFKENGDRCWSCGAGLDWKVMLSCSRCRRLHGRPTAWCLVCFSPMEHVRECSSCHRPVGVSLDSCPACGLSRERVESETVTCGSCGKIVPRGTFCVNCGAPLVTRPAVVTCKKCGHQTPSGNFCLHCGNPLSTGAD